MQKKTLSDSTNEYVLKTRAFIGDLYAIAKVFGYGVKGTLLFKAWDKKNKRMRLVRGMYFEDQGNWVVSSACFEGMEGKKGFAVMKKSQKTVVPPVPFDLTTLQTEAYKNHGITPSKTLESAQRLYIGGVISYPRTGSQKIPKEIG